MLVFTRWYPGGNFTLCIHVMAPDFKSSTQLLIGAAIGTDGKPMPLPSLVAYTVCTQLFGCSPYTLAAAEAATPPHLHRRARLDRPLPALACAGLLRDAG